MGEVLTRRARFLARSLGQHEDEDENDEQGTEADVHVCLLQRVGGTWRAFPVDMRFTPDTFDPGVPRAGRFEDIATG